MRIDIVGYDKIISALPLSGASSRRIRSKLLRGPVLSWIKKSKNLGLYKGIGSKYFWLLTKVFHSTATYWSLALPILVLPTSFLKCSYKVLGRDFYNFLSRKVL